MERKIIHNWGKPLAVIGLVFGIIAHVFGWLAIIPVVGHVLAWFALFIGFFALSFAIPGLIGSYAKKVAVFALVISSVTIFWSIIRLMMYL